jgi:cbb3-type cytochrome oxidase subunit 3
MKYTKILGLAAGISLVAATFLPVQAHALSTASMTLSGASQSNGSFSVVVYENTGSDTVTGAKVDLTFSQAVSGVSYDYGVGPFTAATPSGAHNAYGTVTGQNPVARVTFALASPGTVTATVADSSYLKRAKDDGTGVESFAIDRGSANFTYTAPAPATGGMGGGSSTGTTNNSTKAATNNTTVSNSAVAADETQNTQNDTPKADTSKSSKKPEAKKDNTKKTADKKSGSKAWLLWAIIFAIIAGLYLAGRRGEKAEADAAEAKADDDAAEVVAPAAVVAATTKAASNKSNKNAKNKGGKTNKAKKVRR